MMITHQKTAGLNIVYSGRIINFVSGSSVYVCPVHGFILLKIESRDREAVEDAVMARSSW